MTLEFHNANAERHCLDSDNLLVEAFKNHYQSHKGSRFIWRLAHQDMMDLPEICKDGKKVLNIGGGTSSPVGDNSSGRGTFDPHLSHLLTDLGAIVTNVDIFPEYANVPYEHIVADLTRTRLSELLKGREYDIAIATSFFDSPKLCDCGGWREGFFVDISKDVYDLLTPNGKFFIADAFDLKNERKTRIKALEDIGYSLEIRGYLTEAQIRSMGLIPSDFKDKELFESVCATKRIEGYRK